MYPKPQYTLATTTMNLSRGNALETPVTIALPSSKSESNRALILDALSGQHSQLKNLSSARDTQTMMRLLKSGDAVLDVLDAGTTMRFLTSYVAVRGLQVTLTGTPRMQQRPIKLLVDALRVLGASIEYEKEEGFPPIRVGGMAQQLTDTVSIRGDVSSQYISSLLMVGAILPKGLKLVLTGKIGSRPYIEMTLQLMKRFSIHSHWEGDTITVPQQPLTPIDYTIESDWSGASYWYSMVALAGKGTQVKLLGLRKDSLQGDIRIAEFMEHLGVSSRFEEDGVQLTNTGLESKPEGLSLDFTACPDLAQTVAVAGAGLGVGITMVGLESLRIKETDRIAALQQELAKFNTQLTEPQEGQWVLSPGTLPTEGPIAVATYEDHRMAMAFAPLALLVPLAIEEPGVVAKSYPSYWTDLALAGFSEEEA